MNNKQFKVCVSEGTHRVSVPMIGKASGRQISFKGKLFGVASKQSKLNMSVNFCSRDSVCYEPTARISSKHTEVDADNLTSTESITALSRTPKAKDSAATNSNIR